MAKKESLPEKTPQENERTSTITYANEVVTTIAATALAEVEGIASMSPAPSSGILGKNRTGNRGIRIEMGQDDATVDLYINVEYGTPIQKCATDAQDAVKRAIESMTGLKVLHVDVHVQGVSFEKEKTALEAGSKTAALTDGGDDAHKKAAKKGSRKKTEKPVLIEDPAPEAPAEEPAAEPSVEE